MLQDSERHLVILFSSPFQLQIESLKLSFIKILEQFEEQKTLFSLYFLPFPFSSLSFYLNSAAGMNSTVQCLGKLDT